MSHKWTGAEKWGTAIGAATLFVTAIGLLSSRDFRVWTGLENPAPIERDRMPKPADVLPKPPESSPINNPLPSPVPMPKPNKAISPELEARTRKEGLNRPTDANALIFKGKTGSLQQPSSSAHRDVTPQSKVNNAPNGIINDGGTMVNPTVNNFAPPQRLISEQDRAILIGSLSQHPGKAVFGAISNASPEAFKFAQSLRDIFKASGWDVPEMIQPMMFGGDSWEGVMLTYKGVPNTATDTAQQVSSALTVAHVKTILLNARPDFSIDYIRVVVGPNPQQ